MISMIGLFWAMVALVGWGVANNITRTPARRIGVLSTVFYRNLVVCLFLIPLYIYKFEESGTDISMILFTVLLSIVGYLSLLTLFKAQKTGKVGIIGPISAGGGALVTLIIAVAYFGDILNIFQVLAIILILSGIVFSSISFRDFKSSSLFSRESGLFLALLTALCWGIMLGFMIWPTKALGPYLTVLILNLANLVFSAIHIMVTGDSFKMPDRTSFMVLLLAGICGGLAFIGFNLGLMHAPISIVGPISGANPAIGVIIGILFYKERHPFQHFLGIFFAIIGIVILGLNK